MAEYLKGCSINRVYVCGLATDYCVKFTALDAIDLGFETYLIEDACRGVNLTPGDVQQALEQMQAKGVKVIQSNELVNT